MEWKHEYTIVSYAAAAAWALLGRGDTTTREVVGWLAAGALGREAALWWKHHQLFHAPERMNAYFKGQPSAISGVEL